MGGHFCSTHSQILGHGEHIDWRNELWKTKECGIKWFESWIEFQKVYSWGWGHLGKDWGLNYCGPGLKDSIMLLGLGWIANFRPSIRINCPQIFVVTQTIPHLVPHSRVVVIPTTVTPLIASTGVTCVATPTILWSTSMHRLSFSNTRKSTRLEILHTGQNVPYVSYTMSTISESPLVDMEVKSPHVVAFTVPVPESCWQQYRTDVRSSPDW